MSMQDNQQDYLNYWAQASQCVGLLYSYKTQGQNKDSLSKATDIMNSFMGTWDRNGYFPRPAYADFADGWTSSMDAPTIMVAAQMLYEITDEKRYQDFLFELIPYVVSDCESHGFNLKMEKGLWPLEYASHSTTAETAQFVLNGSLVGYVGCRAIANIYDNSTLSDYLARVEDAYTGMLSQYRFENYTWTRYMLNPNTVIPPHYIIFEIKLFDSMADLTGNKAYCDEAKYRSDALKTVLAPEFTEQSDGRREFVMARACNPHAYLIDVYGTEIQFYDRDGSVVGNATCSVTGDLAEKVDEFYEGAFLAGSVPTDAESYKVFTVYGDTKYELFGGDISCTSTVARRTLSADLSLSLDAYTEDGMTVKVDSRKSVEEEGMLMFDLEAPCELSSSNYYALEVDNSSSEEFGIGLRLEDSSGVSAQRYHTRLKPGKNLILFGELGFNDINDLTDVSRIGFRIYTNGGENMEADLALGNLMYFSSVTSLYDYFSQSDYKVNPQ